MNKSKVTRNLQKELQLQEKLKTEIAEKKNLLSASNKRVSVYRKWLKKMDQLETTRIRKMEELEQKLKEDSLKKYQKPSAIPAEKHSTDSEPMIMQNLFDLSADHESLDQ